MKNLKLFLAAALALISASVGCFGGSTDIQITVRGTVKDAAGNDLKNAHHGSFCYKLVFDGATDEDCIPGIETDEEYGKFEYVIETAQPLEVFTNWAKDFKLDQSTFTVTFDGVPHVGKIIYDSAVSGSSECGSGDPNDCASAVRYRTFEIIFAPEGTELPETVEAEAQEQS